MAASESKTLSLSLFLNCAHFYLLARETNGFFMIN